MNTANAPLDQAVTEARNALDAAYSAERPDMADIQVKADKLATAELTRPWRAPMHSPNSKPRRTS